MTLEANGRNQNKFKETEPARQEYQGNERSVNRRSMMRYMAKNKQANS